MKAIGSGKIRRKSNQKKELEQIKMNFDVVYQPQINNMFASNDNSSKFQMEEEPSSKNKENPFTGTRGITQKYHSNLKKNLK